MTTRTKVVFAFVLLALGFMAGAFIRAARAQAVPDPITYFRDKSVVCGPSHGFTAGVGNTPLVSNDGGTNRIYLCSAMFNMPISGSFGLIEGPPANNCAIDAGTTAQQLPVACGLNNDGGTCFYNAGGGFLVTGQGPGLSTAIPGNSLCVSTDAGVTGTYTTTYAP